MNIKSFYISQFFRSLAEAMISPFLSIFFLFLGATKTLIGLASTLPSLANLFSQLLWSNLSEATYKKKVFVIFGGVAWALLWIPIALVREPLLLVFLLTIQALLSAASTPAWTSLLIHLTPRYKTAQVQGNLNLMGNFAHLIGTLVAGLILNQFGFLPFFFYLIAFLGLVSRIPFLHSREPRMPYTSLELVNILKKTFDFSRMKKEKEMVKLMATITFLNFSVSLASPFLSVFVVTSRGGSVINIAMISIIGALTMIVFSRPWGSIVDKGSKKLVMLACIIPISLIPLIYVVVPSIEWIYLYEVIGALSWTGFNLATFAYLANIIPREKIDSSVGFYNLFVGLGSSLGPILGGTLSEFIGLKNLFFISTFLRFLTMIMIEKLEEKPGLKPKANLIFEFFGLAYRVENFLSTYSLLMSETLKQGIKLLNFRKQFRKGLSIFSSQKGSKLLKRK